MKPTKKQLEMILNESVICDNAFTDKDLMDGYYDIYIPGYRGNYLFMNEALVNKGNITVEPITNCVKQYRRLTKDYDHQFIEKVFLNTNNEIEIHLGS